MCFQCITCRSTAGQHFCSAFISLLFFFLTFLFSYSSFFHHFLYTSFSSSVYFSCFLLISPNLFLSYINFSKLLQSFLLSFRFSFFSSHYSLLILPSFSWFSIFLLCNLHFTLLCAFIFSILLTISPYLFFHRLLTILGAFPGSQVARFYT